MADVELEAERIARLFLDDAKYEQSGTNGTVILSLSSAHNSTTRMIDSFEFNQTLTSLALSGRIYM
ncbi:MAG: hypothetical protein GY799_13310 [Desulfobulbaceae bacterium]|nr:hypothetical protein [Desulfobulbaceae bacterium]